MRRLFVVRQDEAAPFDQTPSTVFEENRLPRTDSPHAQSEFRELISRFISGDWTHFLFLGSGKLLTQESLILGLEQIDPDPMIVGFQYAWTDALNPYFIPFLMQDLFCVKRKFVIDFLETNLKQDIFAADAHILESSFKANRVGYRFYGIPQIPYRLNPDFFSRTNENLKHYDAILANHVSSQDFAWNEFSSRFRFNDEPNRILLDLGNFGPSHIGTVVAGFNLLKAIYRIADIGEITVCSSTEVRDFLKLEDEFPRWRWLSSETATSEVFEIAFELGQPWYFERAPFFNKNCFSVFFLFYDVIAWDCLYIRQVFPDLDRLWKYWTRFASGLVFGSQYTRDLLSRRFPEANDLPGATCLLSTSVDDYKDQVSLSSNSPIVPAVDLDLEYFLIFGNFYHHKYVHETIETLLPLLGSQEHLVVVGAFDGKSDEKIIHLSSGAYSRNQISDIYQRAKAVVFPSYYEGFGLPIPEALANDKIVFARETPLVKEILNNWDGPGGIILFGDNDDLKTKFARFNEKRPVEILTGHSSIKNNWDRMAKKTIEFILSTHQLETNLRHVEDRFRTFDLIQSLNKHSDRGTNKPLSVFQNLVDRS